MNKYTQFALLSASTLRMLPHIALYLLHRKQIDGDLEKYQDKRGGVINFIKVCTRERVYRNLFYYRMGDYRSVFIKWLLPPERTLHIWCPEIGQGAHFEHNYATYLTAEHKVEQLLDAVAQTAPKQSAGGFLFQTLHATGGYALFLRCASR